MGKLNKKIWIEIAPGYFAKVDRQLQKYANKVIRKWRPKIKKLSKAEARALALKLLRNHR
jgi:hypothetical protein